MLALGKLNDKSVLNDIQKALLDTDEAVVLTAKNVLADFGISVIQEVRVPKTVNAGAARSINLETRLGKMDKPKRRSAFKKKDTTAEEISKKIRASMKRRKAEEEQSKIKTSLPR